MHRLFLRIGLVGGLTAGGLACDAGPPSPNPEATPLPDPVVERAAKEVLAYQERPLGSGDPQTLVLAIHGLQDSPEHFAEYAHLDQIPISGTLVVPAGPLEDHGYRSWFTLRARSGDTEGLAKNVRDTCGVLEEFLAAYQREHPEVERVHLLGYSQGGMIAMGCGVLHPASYVSVSVFSGWLVPPLLDEVVAGESYPVFVAAHGKADKSVTYGPAEKAAMALRERGVSVQWLAFDETPHMISDEMRNAVFQRLGE